MSDTQDFEYEEISSDEVDGVVAALQWIRGTVSSETIKLLIEECSSSIYDLVYEGEEEFSNEAA